MAAHTVLSATSCTPENYRTPNVGRQKHHFGTYNLSKEKSCETSASTLCPPLDGTKTRNNLKASFKLVGKEIQASGQKRLVTLWIVTFRRTRQDRLSGRHFLRSLAKNFLQTLALRLAAQVASSLSQLLLCCLISHHRAF